MAPGQLGDVDEAVDALQIYECAEVHYVGDGPGDQVAHVHAVEDLLADPAALLFQDRATA